MIDVTEFEYLDTEELHLVKDGANTFLPLLAKAASTVDEAQGEANAFSQVFAQYQQNPRVITLKLLNDTLSSVMNNVGRVFFVQPHQQIILSMPPPPRKVNIQSAQ